MEIETEAEAASGNTGERKKKEIKTKEKKQPPPNSIKESLSSWVIERKLHSFRDKVVILEFDIL
eukprot:351916-Amorphochlora_amoeboformis.AAC.1